MSNINSPDTASSGPYFNWASNDKEEEDKAAASTQTNATTNIAGNTSISASKSAQATEKMTFTEIYEILMQTMQNLQKLSIQVTDFMQYQEQVLQAYNELLSQVEFLTDQFNYDDMDDDEKEKMQSMYDSFNSYVAQPAYTTLQADQEVVQGKASDSQNLLEGLSQAINSLMNLIKAMIDSETQSMTAPYR